MVRVAFLFSIYIALLPSTRRHEFTPAQLPDSRPVSRTEYELPGTSWRAWESRLADEKASYSVFTTAEVAASSPALSLHLTCSGARYDIFVRTSASVASEPSQRYHQNLVEVRLRHFDEAVTKSYLFTPLEDNHGLYLYKALVPGDGPTQGIERLLGHPKTRIEFSARPELPIAAVLDLQEMKNLYQKLQTACRSGRPLGEVEPRLVALGPSPPEIRVVDTGEDDPARPEGSAPLKAPADPGAADAPSVPVVSVFGLSMGLALEDVAQRIGGSPLPVPEQPQLYALPRVPDPNPDFEIYLGLIRPETGLCEIRAVGKAINSDPGGTAIRHVFHNNVALLSRLFGPYRLVDPDAGDPEAGRDDWMERLYTTGSHLLAEWSRGRESHLGEDIEKIILTVRAESEITARLVLQVTFSNFARAQAQPR